MALIDDRGRVFGRLNLVDAATVIVLVGLLPIGYGAYLLFRPSTPRIESVTQVPLTREELRIADGATIKAKLKVRGTGFNPLLRAQIGGVPALAFVFENDNSADVMVGDIPAGPHDLVLYDGVHEVARARGAVSIEQATGTTVRAVGRFVGLDEGKAKDLKPGFKSAGDDRGAFAVVAIGAARPAVSTVTMGSRAIDMPLPGVHEHPAVLLIRCDEPTSVCSIGGVRLQTEPPVQVLLPGGYSFVIDELLPTTPPARARVEVAVEGPQARAIQSGDRDVLIDERAAVVTSISGGRVTLDLGADRSREGWSYRGQRLRAGAPFLLQTSQYEIEGMIVSVAVTEPR
jgi:hypothetical protein